MNLKAVIDVLEAAKGWGIKYLPIRKAVKENSAIIEDKIDLKTLKENSVIECRLCSLHASKKNIVFGEGNPKAVLMFIGEAPGADEDTQGRPFVGQAGQLLTKIIEAIDLTRDDVYIANILKCRPPQNRDPLENEVAMCKPYLMKQIEIINPGIICALGRVAAQVMLNTTTSISKLRGRFHKLGDIMVMPTFHPSYLLRNPSGKRPVWEDMKMIRKEYDKIIARGKN